MDSFQRGIYNNPLIFTCTMCNENQSKYLPAGTKMTTCRKCGNLITISQLPRQRQNQGPQIAQFPRMTIRNPSNQGTRRPIFLSTPFRLHNNNHDVEMDDNNDDDDEEERDYYNDYESNMYSNPSNFRNSNETTNTLFRNRSNRSNRSNRTNPNTNTNTNQEQQGMFSLHIPNDRYNRRSNLARVMHNHNSNDIFNEYDFQQDFENEMNEYLESANRLLGLRSIVEQLDKLPTIKPPKPKLSKTKMTKKLFTKNAKGKLEAPTCCICLNNLKLAEQVTQLKCKHLYHYACLEKWIETKEECPFCRGKIV